MRIAQIIESSSGGSARAALALSRELARMGEDVTLIYSPVRADDMFERELKTLSGVRTIPLPMRRSVGLNDAATLVRLCRILKQTGPFDILHGHSSKAGALARLAGLFFPSARVVYTPHAFVTMGGEGSRFYAFAERLLGRLGEAIIAVSQEEKDHGVKTLGLAEEKIRVIPNGVTFEPCATRGEARSRMGYSEKEKVVGFAGRLSAQKNPTRLIEAFARSSETFPDARLAVVGSGPLRDELLARARVFAVENRMKLWEGQEARFFIPGFDVFLCASDYEGFPLVFIEALLSGVPIVTTRVGGARVCVAEGETGFLAEEFSAPALSRALDSYLVLDAQARKSMSEAACLRGAYFSVERMARAACDLYREISGAS